VDTGAASAFRPHTSSDFETILACSNAARCLVAPYTRRWTESTSMNASVSAPGSSGVCSASPARAGMPVTFWLDATIAHLLVDGVRLKTLPSRLTIAQLTTFSRTAASGRATTDPHRRGWTGRTDRGRPLP